MVYTWALNGNWIDLLIIIILLLSVWEGFGRGLFFGIIDLAGFLISFLSALKLYLFVGELLVVNFALSRGIAHAIGFLLAGFASQLAYSLLVNIVYPFIPKKLQNAKWNSLLGFIPSLGSGAIFTSFILTLLISLPIRGSIKADILSSKLGGPLVRQTQGVERQLRSIFGEAVSETLTFLTIPTTSQEHLDLNFTQKELTLSPEDEQIMLGLLNGERTQIGLPALKKDQALTSVARAHAKDMFERGYFSHYTPEGSSPFDRMERAGIQFSAAGENLALAPSVQLAHQGLMNSKGHRENILSSDFGKVGIGAIDGGVYGIMFVQEFTD